MYSVIVIKKEAADYITIPMTELAGGANEFRDDAEQFRAFHRWAGRNGYASGFTHYHQADDERGHYFGAIMFKKPAVDRLLTPLQDSETASFEQRFYSVDQRTDFSKYIGGFPDYEQGVKDGATVFGAIYVKHGYADRKVVSAAELKNPQNILQLFQNAHSWAENQSDENGERYLSGFPILDSTTLSSPSVNYPLRFRQEDNFGDFHMITDVTISKSGLLVALTETNNHVALLGNCGTVSLWLLDKDGNQLRRHGSLQFCVDGTANIFGSAPVRHVEWNFNITPDVFPQVAGVSILHGEGDKDFFSLTEGNIERAKQLVKKVKGD